MFHVYTEADATAKMKADDIAALVTVSSHSPRSIHPCSFCTMPLTVIGAVLLLLSLICRSGLNPNPHDRGLVTPAKET